MSLFTSQPNFISLVRVVFYVINPYFMFKITQNYGFEDKPSKCFLTIFPNLSLSIWLITHRVILFKLNKAQDKNAKTSTDDKLTFTCMFQSPLAFTFKSWLTAWNINMPWKIIP